MCVQKLMKHASFTTKEDIRNKRKLQNKQIDKCNTKSCCKAKVN